MEAITAATAAVEAAAHSQAAEPTAVVSQPSLAEPPSEYGDAESEITGAASETDGEGMDIEAVLDGIPQSQRVAVRRLLEAKKARRARALQRLKKPSTEQGGAVTRQQKKK